MKSRFTIFYLLLCAPLVIAAGCTDSDDEPVSKDFVLNAPDTYEMAAGMQKIFIISSGGGEYEAVSSNPEILSAEAKDAVVDIKALGPGEATVTIRDVRNGKSESITFTLYKAPFAVVGMRNGITIHSTAAVATSEAERRVLGVGYTSSDFKSLTFSEPGILEGSIVDRDGEVYLQLKSVREDFIGTVTATLTDQYDRAVSMDVTLYAKLIFDQDPNTTKYYADYFTRLRVTNMNEDGELRVTSNTSEHNIAAWFEKDEDDGEWYLYIDNGDGEYSVPSGSIPGRVVPTATLNVGTGKSINVVVTDGYDEIVIESQLVAPDFEWAMKHRNVYGNGYIYNLTRQDIQGYFLTGRYAMNGWPAAWQAGRLNWWVANTPKLDVITIDPWGVSNGQLTDAPFTIEYLYETDIAVENKVLRLFFTPFSVRHFMIKLKNATTLDGEIADRTDVSLSYGATPWTTWYNRAALEQIPTGSWKIKLTDKADPSIVRILEFNITE